MEKKLDTIDSRTFRVEQNIRSISTNMATVKCDLTILKSLMVEFLDDFQPNQYSEGPNNQIDDSLVLKSSHKIAQIDEIEEHKNEIEDEENVKEVAEIESEMNFINGASVEEITASTWEQFFEKRVETKARDVNRFLIFALSKAEAISGSSQRQWILIRVYKAQYGRSPILNWRGKLIGLGYCKQKAHIFIHLLQNPNQQLRTCLQNTTEPFSFNAEFATSEARQIAQDEEAKSVADYYSSDEPYEAWYGVLIFNFPDCLVLNLIEFENSRMSSTTYNFWKVLFLDTSKVEKLEMEELIFWDKPEDSEMSADIRMNILWLAVHSYFAENYGVNWKVLFAYSFFVGVRLWSFVVEVLKLLCLLRHNQEALSLLETQVEKDVQVFFGNKIARALLQMDAPGIGLINRKGLILLLLVGVSKPNNSLVCFFPVVSHLSLVENLYDVQYIVLMALASEKGSFFAMGFFVAEWFNRGNIHWYYCMVLRILFPPVVLPLIEHDNSVRRVIHFVQNCVSTAMARKKRWFDVTGPFGVAWFHTGIIYSGWKAWYCCVFIDVLTLFKQFQILFLVHRQFIVGSYILLFLTRVTRSRKFWLGKTSYLVLLIQDMLTIVQASKLVITAMTNWLETWLKSFYIKKQKLILMLAYHLVDKVAIHGGGNDEIGPSCTYYRKWRNEVMVK